MAIIGIVMLAHPVSAQKGTVSRRPATVDRKPTPTNDRKPTPTDDGRTGLMLGVYTIGAMGLSISGNDVDGTIKTNFGPGAGLSVGYGFNQTFSAFASFDLAKQGTSGDDFQGNFGLTHFQVGARANLPYGSPVNVPYLSASVGRRALSARVVDEWEEEPYNMSLTGMVFGLGGGIQHVISPTLSIDGGLDLTFGRFSKVDQDEEPGSIDTNGSTGMRIRIGVTWRPGTRRSS